jgi:hypothetical protein
MLVRFPRQQENRFPQFSCVTPRTGAWPFRHQAREGNQTKEKNNDWHRQHIAGANISVGRDGTVGIDRGLVRPEDAPSKTGNGGSPSSEASSHDQSPAFSSALIESLTAHNRRRSQQSGLSVPTSR